MLNGSRQVILFLPPYSGKLLGSSAGACSVWPAQLRAAGYEPLIIDGAFDRDYMLQDSAKARRRALLRRIATDRPDDSRRVIAKPHGAAAASGSADRFWRLASEPADSGDTLAKTLSTSLCDIRAIRRWWKLRERLVAGNSLDMVCRLLVQDGRRADSSKIRTGRHLRSRDLPAPAYDLANFEAYAQRRQRTASYPTPRASVVHTPAIIARTGLLQPPFQRLRGRPRRG